MNKDQDLDKGVEKKPIKVLTEKICVEDMDPIEGVWRRRDAEERGEVWP